ncbi:MULTISPECIES: hypothetical protein [unclassified Mesorhizobium]|uniref:hypothetical protein n=1 Tax=unclassified Mesorhizobium TaxID=325217 RepID=UPI0012DE2DD7|nr:hypothetical protein [Mesorhizobium sp. L2C067A000]
MGDACAIERCGRPAERAHHILVISENVDGAATIWKEADDGLARSGEPDEKEQRHDLVYSDPCKRARACCCCLAGNALRCCRSRRSDGEGPRRPASACTTLIQQAETGPQLTNEVLGSVPSLKGHLLRKLTKAAAALIALPGTSPRIDAGRQIRGGATLPEYLPGRSLT